MTLFIYPPVSTGGWCVGRAWVDPSHKRIEGGQGLVGDGRIHGFGGGDPGLDLSRVGASLWNWRGFSARVSTLFLVEVLGDAVAEFLDGVDAGDFEHLSPVWRDAFDTEEIGVGPVYSTMALRPAAEPPSARRVLTQAIPAWRIFWPITETMRSMSP